MTPFGLHLRTLREQRGITQKEMATALGVSAAYLSALEHGQRGKPSWALLQRIVGFFNVIWDEAEELQKLAGLSSPRVTIDTSKLSSKAMLVANLLGENIAQLDDAQLDELLDSLNGSAS